MSISTNYLLNVALHAVILSVFAGLVLMALRQARHRSVAAIAGLLAVGFLPWLTALRPAQPMTTPVPEIQTQDAPALPTWAVMTLPAKQTETPVPAAAPGKFVFPDPLVFFATIWAAGAGAGLLLLAIASLKVRSWRKSLLPLDDTMWQSLQGISPQVPGRNDFLLSETTASPCVTGLFLPRIVLPRFLLESRSAEKLRWAVRHEIAHWQAGDSRWMILFALIRCVNWWNPLVHRLVSRWADAREQLCDLHATGVSDSRADYGEFLITIARKVTERPLLTVSMAKRPHALRLKRRIVSLLDAEPGAEKPVGKRWIGLGCGAALFCAAMVSCMRVGTNAGITSAQTGAVLSDSKAPSSPEPPVGHFRAIPEGSRQIKITAKLLVTSPQSNFVGVNYNDESVERILKKFQKTGKATLTTTPSVTAKSGQRAIVEAVHEIPKPGQPIKERTANSSVPFVGINLSFVPRHSGGLAVDLRQTVDYRYVPGVWRFDGTDSKPPAGLNPAKIKTIKRTIDSHLLAGNTVFTNLGEIEPGIHLALLTKAEVIDANGRSLDDFKGGLPSAIEADPVPGFRPLPKEDPADFPQDPPVRNPLKKS